MSGIPRATRRSLLLVLAFCSILVLPALPGAQARAAGAPTLPTDRLQFGLASGPSDLSWMTGSGVPWAYRYQYISGGVNTSGNWETWQDPSLPAGQFALDYVTASHSAGYIPVFSWYEMLQSSPSTGSDESDRDFSNLNDRTTMASYYASFALLMERSAQAGGTVIVQVEPDLWGYLQQRAGGGDASTLSASVSSSGYTGVAGYPNTAAGFGAALIHLRDVYAPNVLLGVHASMWSSGIDLASDTSPTVNAAAEADKTAAFLDSTGSWDLVFNDVDDHDAAWWEAQGDDNQYFTHWWDPTNTVFPNFQRYLDWVSELHAKTGLPQVAWQVPEGNQYYLTMNNTCGHYQDNVAQYFIGHASDLSAAGLIAVLFGAGNACQTTNTDADGDGVSNNGGVPTTDVLGGCNACNTHVSTVSDDDGGYLRMAVGAYYALPESPTGVTATSTASGQAAVSWTPPSDYLSDVVTGYAVTTYNDQGTQVGTPQSVARGSTSSTTVTGLTNGTPWYFSVASVNLEGSSAGAESNSVTPLSGATPAAAETAVTTLQYLLPNSDGTTWQVMDESNLAFTITPGSTENVLLSANADLWTFNAGYNQDIGIQVTPGSGTPVLAAWKEAGGFAGTFSPNAAFVETVYPMSAGTTYTVQIVWKTNKAAIGATIAAGAGPISSAFSPTRLTADVLPAGYQSLVSTQQYRSVNSNGSTWAEIDPTHLVTTAFAPSSAVSEVVSGNADLWTANAGYNQDLGIFVSVNGGTPVLVAWKESGGFAGTFSPNAAFVQTVYAMTAGNTYVFSLWWKTNKPANGTIFVGAGPIGSAYSPTRLTAYLLPADSAPDQWATAASTEQYSSINSDGSTWVEMDATNLATSSIAIGSGGTAETVLVSGNADLWTANNGYNQDLGIEVSVNGGTPTLVAWKESGGFAGNFSPNAAFVQAVYTMQPGNSYVFSLWWKANKPAQGIIFAGAGPLGSAYSPARLTVVPRM